MLRNLFFVLVIAVVFWGCASKKLYNTSDNNEEGNISEIFGTDLIVKFVVDGENSLKINSFKVEPFTNKDIDEINSFNKKNRKMLNCIILKKDTTYDICNEKLDLTVYKSRQVNTDPVNIILSPVGLAIDTVSLLTGNKSFSNSKKMVSRMEFDKEILTDIGQSINNIMVKEYKSKTTLTEFEKYINENKLEALISNSNTVKNDTKFFKKLIDLYEKDNSFDSFVKLYSLTKDLNFAKKALNIEKKDIDKDRIYQLLVSNNNEEFLFQYLRDKKTVIGYVDAFKYSKNIQDIRNADNLAVTNTDKLLVEKVLSSNLNEKDEEQKALLIKIYRNKNNIDSYIKAYNLSKNKNDLRKSYEFAKNSEEKAKIEKLVFESLQNKDGLIHVEMNLEKATFDDKQTNGGMFSKATIYGYVYPRGNVSIRLNNNLPYQPTYGIYNVKLTFKTEIPRNYQLRSSWLGNKDKTDDISIDDIVEFQLKPPYNKLSKDFYFEGKTIAYFDRGSQGGYTAIWPSDDAKVSLKNVEITLSNFDYKSQSSFDVNFDNLSTFNQKVNLISSYIYGSYDKGNSYVNTFSTIATENTRRTYSSGQNSQCNWSSGTNCFQITKKINNYRYEIECTKGNKIGQRREMCANSNFKWATGCGLGDSFAFHDNSLSNAANKWCDY